MEEKEVKKTRKYTRKKKEKVEIEMVKKSVEFSLVEVIIIVLITGIVVSLASGFIVYKKLNNNVYISACADNELKDIEKHYNTIVNEYVSNVDKKGLIEAAIKGMYNYLEDEYSMYIDTDNSEDFSEILNGEYTGIGIEISTLLDENNNTYAEINRVFENTPASEVGLKKGDIITEINGVKVTDGAMLADTIKRGTKSEFIIKYLRDGKEYSVSIERKKVFINSVESKEYDNVGYIKLDTFSKTTYAQVLNKLDDFSKNVDSLVIDLRDNTGGYLDTAHSVSELFLEKGKVIYQIKDRNGNVQKYVANKGAYKEFKKIVVIINQSSASASEILALALKESAGAVIVGKNSYGKGTVQEAQLLDSGAMVKYTTSYWLSPDGNSINKIGIKPDIIELDESKQIDVAIKAAK